MRFCLVVASLLLFSASLSAQSQEMRGRVVGTVVDDEGESLGGAMVCFTKFDSSGIWTGGCERASDNGEFDMHVPIDTDRIYANKPEAGYLEANYMAQAGLAIHLSEVQPVAHLVLKLGPKPAHLTINVSAKESGRPIERFTMTWFIINGLPAGLKYHYSTSRNSLAVPSDRGVMIFVEAPGYRRWFYLDPANSGQPTVRLRPGEEKNIDAALELSAAQD